MTEYYIAPDGSDGNDGSNSSPWYSLGAASGAVSAGDTVIVQGGSYDYTSAQRLSGPDGTSANPITVRAADGASPTISFGGSGSGGWGASDDGSVKVNAANWILDGLEIADSPYYGVQINSGGSGSVIRNCEVHDNHLVGIGSYGADDLTISGCTAYNNAGSTSDGGDSDGIQLAQTTNSVIRDCEAYRNSDDGFDLWESSDVLVDNCRASDNGSDGGDGNGFKMGGGAGSGNNTIQRSAAWNNDFVAFNYNAAEDPVTFYNNTSWNNGQGYFAEGGSVLRNNVSYADDRAKSTSNTDEEANTWNLGIDDPQFESTDSSAGNFLQPASESPCVDAGVDVGLSFSGEAPDLGYVEVTTTTETTESSSDTAILYHDGSGWQEL